MVVVFVYMTISAGEDISASFFNNAGTSIIGSVMFALRAGGYLLIFLTLILIVVEENFLSEMKRLYWSLAIIGESIFLVGFYFGSSI